ncbi:hypothetical protein N7532_001261 [Penicillium argentinense]|uniref:Asteroid domain-containing protein n=1 Tax=Penicillium argentinense TaxID=1131581 RepID=A0A9W9G246_9EURO|nr:uncharacterized protein N7532_001261 [Penicillium argentinense]KAJ5110726.1 hypothetical protein N7532_001261 [Penicillium argentinense]
MGIPHLTRHLTPYAETVSLGQNSENTELCYLNSVVVDGPSLVYHVYHRLLACMDPACEIWDVQPTCNEVSRGVVSFLSQLASVGVKVERICFDGALPVSKRITRLSRLEKSRSKLELCRRRPVTASTRQYRKELSIEPMRLWQGRSLPSRWKNMPENPFMVSAVLEDLLHRWTRKLALEEFPRDATLLPDTEYPWADITVIVPGEADVECARIARATGSAILTSDSDLLLYDLGSGGSVVFLNSMQMIDNAENSARRELHAQRIHPCGLSHRLGIRNIQLFAYELKRHPQIQFNELLRRSKAENDTKDHSVEYYDFLREYQHEPDHHSATNEQISVRHLDPRVSELFWQFESPGAYCVMDQPHVYLGILNEDHSRRCAWEQGRIYRSLGYSIHNIGRPMLQRFSIVHEFVRRGGRIVAEPVTLAGEKTVVSDLVSLQERLDVARDLFDCESMPRFWFLFALAEIYRDPSNATTVPNAKQLECFLGNGFMGKGTEWAEIHLVAQVQAVLYSLRMLKQLLHKNADSDEFGQYRCLLVDLPPLYILMRSRHGIAQDFSEKESRRRAVHQMVRHYG